MFCDDGERCPLGCTDKRNCSNKPVNKLRQALWHIADGTAPRTDATPYMTPQEINIFINKVLREA